MDYINFSFKEMVLQMSVEISYQRVKMINNTSCYKATGRLFAVATFLGLSCSTNLYAAPQDKFEIVIQATRLQTSETVIQGKTEYLESQYPFQVIITVRGRNILHQEILQNQGQSRKNQGTAYDINGTVNCVSSKLNPFAGSKYRQVVEKTSRTDVSGRSCSATSQMTDNFIDLSQVSNDTSITKTREYVFDSVSSSSTRTQVTYDLAARTCEVKNLSSTLDLSATAISGNFLNNSQRVKFNVIQSNCLIRRI